MLSVFVTIVVCLLVFVGNVCVLCYIMRFLLIFLNCDDNVCFLYDLLLLC